MIEQLILMLLDSEAKRAQAKRRAPLAERLSDFRHGDIVDCGSAVRTKSFRFLSDDEIELRNVYAADLRDVGWLLQHVGQRLG